MRDTWKFHCTQCGNRTVADVLCTGTETEWHTIGDDHERHDIPHEWYYATIKCQTCGTVQLYTYGDHHEEGLDQAILLYPTTRSVPKDVPALIAKEFAEAQKVEKISRAAYAVLIGRVLERLFQDKGAEGQDLYSQIKDLSKKNIIPEMLCEMSHTLRFLRNKGAHATDYVIEDDEVEAIKDFIITMLEYVYVAPAKLAAFNASIERKKSGVSKPSI